MTAPSTGWRRRAVVLALGVLAFGLLTIRFSPNWVAFGKCVREIAVDATDATRRAAIEEAVLSGFSERGLHVVRQARDLRAEIRDSNHKIVRWRLLMPAIGHVLGLPDWGTLALAHLGCLAWILALTALGHAMARSARRPVGEAAGLALVAGASAPFFTSMGLLGYYDSWLALALLAVAFGPGRGLVLLACLLGPWIDERFVIGLPLALVVRWNQSDSPPENWRSWLKAEAALPLLLALGYGVLRLKLGGSGSSQTVAEYFRQFVLTPKVRLIDRLAGAWSGLLVGWTLVIAAVVLPLASAKTRRFLRPGLLAAAIAVTGLVGLYTALDLSRSIALLTPVVPLGWLLASRQPAWSRFHFAAVLAVAALLIPATHVMGRFRLPVDNVWTPSVPLTTAQNNVGLMYDKGERVPRDVVKAACWFQRSAAAGHAEAQNNLAAKHLAGEGVPQDFKRAVELLRMAAAQDSLPAIYNLGYIHSLGQGVPKDHTEAARWYRRAAERGFANAQNNLGAMYLDGVGVPRDVQEGLRWYTRAADQGMATAAANLGVIHQEGLAVPTDLVAAYKWFLLATALGDAKAREQLASLEKRLTPAQMSAGRKLAQEAVDRLRKKP